MVEQTDNVGISAGVLAGGASNTLPGGNDRGVTFLSIHWSRLLAGGILALTGLLDMNYLGYAIGNHTGTGSALVLGGPSFFWLIGMPIMAIGCLLILYFLVSPLKYTFKFDAQGSTFDAQGRWLRLHWSYHVSPVSRITYQRRRLGPKTIWIATLVPWIVWIIEYGAGLFDLPRSVSNTLPTMMILTAMSDVAALAVLIFFMPSSLRVYSADNVYEFWVSCPPRNNVLERYLQNQLIRESVPIVTKGRTSYTRLATGGVLCAGSLLGLYADVLFGEWFAMVGLVYGIVILLEALFLDLRVETRQSRVGSPHYTALCNRTIANLWLEIEKKDIDEERTHQLSRIPPWQGLIIAYLLANIFTQLIFAARVGAITGYFSIVDYTCSILFAGVVGLGFARLLHEPNRILATFLPGLIIGLFLGLII